jgi:hypothetical protein
MTRSAIAAAALCLVPYATAQWATPMIVANVNSASLEYSPSPTFDGLTLYFASTLSGSGDIYRATRTTPYGTFGAPVLVPELSAPEEDWSTWSRIDDREIFFSSQRQGGGGGGYDLWRADRPTPTSPYNAPVPVTELNTSGSEYSPSLTGNGLRIYFTTSRAGGSGGTDIWTATRPNWFMPFGTPTPVTELNSTTTDRDPRVSTDDLVMFFTSTRTGGAGNIDLWMASRPSPSVPFGNLVNLTALNSTAIDFTPGIAGFHDELFFSSGRPGGAGGWEIYSTRFTGVLGVGIAGPSSTQELRFSDPGSPGLPYVAASALGDTPGIQLGSRNLPLNPDPLLTLTVGGLPPILNGYRGLLNGDGTASARIAFQGYPHLVGLRFYTAFLVLDPTAPFGIKTISNSHLTLVQ